MSGFLSGDPAMAAVVLWASGQFDTSQIAALLSVREDAVYRTLHDVRDTAAAKDGKRDGMARPA